MFLESYHYLHQPDFDNTKLWIVSLNDSKGCDMFHIVCGSLHFGFLFILIIRYKIILHFDFIFWVASLGQTSKFFAQTN